MALTVKLKAGASEETATATELEQLIDDIGKQNEKLEKTKAKLKEETAEYTARVSKLKELVCDPVEQDQVYEFGTDRYHCRFGAAGKERVFKAEGLEELKLVVGIETFMKIAKVNLKDVDDYTTPEERKEILDELRNEKRVFSVEKKKG